MFLIKNLSQFNNKPQRFKDHIFQRLFKVSEISKFTPKQITSYEDSSKQYRDLQNSFETARDEAMADGRAKVLKKGLQQGIEQGIGNEKLDVVKQMKIDGVNPSKISKYTRLSTLEIEKL